MKPADTASEIVETDTSKYIDKLKEALRVSVRIDGVKKIWDQARQLQLDAGEIQIRAERRLGELIKQLEQTTGGI